jgi:hypothetical protein
MEGSMKMMSWSRYHCLSSSLLRAGRRTRATKSRKARFHKIWQRHHISHPHASVFAAGNALTRYFQFVIRLFRT